MNSKQLAAWLSRFLIPKQKRISDPKWLAVLAACAAARAAEREAAGNNTLWEERPGITLDAIEAWLAEPTSSNKDKWAEAFSLMPYPRFEMPDPDKLLNR